MEFWKTEINLECFCNDPESNVGGVVVGAKMMREPVSGGLEEICQIYKFKTITWNFEKIFRLGLIWHEIVVNIQILSNELEFWENISTILNLNWGT